MFYKKPGFPEQGEIVVGTVKKVLYHSVFVILDEYGKEGMIHLPEISPGRIRNIRDFVKEGKKVVCKILNVNKERGHIDLSLRRVSKSQKINKNREYKQEEKAEKLLNEIAKDLKISLEDIYKEAGYKIIEKYGLLTLCFQDVVSNNVDLSSLEIQKKIVDPLTKLIKEKIKPPEVMISGILKLSSNSGEGIEVIKKTLNHAKNFNKKYGINLSYMGAPKYKIIVKAKDYKKAEHILKEVTDSTIEFIDNAGGLGSFDRK